MNNMTIVEGRIEEWEGGHLHVHWPCPICRHEHNFDFDEEDTNPRLACCETGNVEDTFLVKWKEGS